MMEDTIVGDEDVHVDERYIFGIYTWLVCKHCIQLCITPACVNCVYTTLFYFSTLDVSARQQVSPSPEHSQSAASIASSS